MLNLRVAERGFTLIEILIAMAVFLIGVVAIIGVFPEGIRTTSKSVDDAVAGYLAQSVRDAIVDAIRHNVKDEENDNPNDGYFIRWFHDGLPATGATFRLARTFLADATDPTQWGDAAGTRYNIPDYFGGATTSFFTPGSWDYAGPPNPNATGAGGGMLTAGPQRVTLNRGWWFPDQCLSTDKFGTAAGEAASLCNANTPSGGALATDAALRNNNGVEVVRLGTLTGTTSTTAITGPLSGNRNIDFPDPLALYSFQFICQIANDLTPGGDRVDGDPTNYIPCTPFPSEYDLIPNAFYPDGPPPGALSPPSKYQDRVMKDMRPGLASITIFPFKNWRSGMTGLEGTTQTQVDRDEAREQNCVHLTQILASFTQ